MGGEVAVAVWFLKEMAIHGVNVTILPTLLSLWYEIPLHL